MSKEEKDLSKLIEEAKKRVQNEDSDIKKGRDLGKGEWTSESIERSYKPIKDEQGTPPPGDDSDDGDDR